MKKILSILKSKLLWTIIIIVGGAFVYLNYFAPEETVVEQLYTVTRGDVSQSVLLSGTVDAVGKADLSFGIAGKIESVHFEQGAVVEEGQVLAQLDTDILEADLLKAKGDVQSALANIRVSEASVQKAQAALDLVRADNRGDVTTLESAAEKLEETKNEQEVLVENARQDLLKNDLQVYPEVVVATLPAFTLTGSYSGGIEDEYRLRVYLSSQSNIGFSIDYSGVESGTVHFKGFDTPERLGNNGLFINFPSSGSGLNYNNSRWVIPIPNNRSTTYQTKLSAFNAAQTNATLAVTNAENDLQKLQAQEEGEVALTSAEEQQAIAALAEAEGSLAQAEGALLQARANVVRVEAQIEDAKIVAPFSGTLARIDFTEGETVAASEIGMTLITDGNFELSMNVPEIDIAKIGLDDTARITLDVYGPDVFWEGMVTGIELIETEVDGVPVYESTITVNQPDSRVRVGMNARAEIVLSQSNDVLAVPISYLKEEGNSFIATIKVNTETREDKVVELGLRGTNNFVEIKSGLEQGDIIIRPSD